MKKILILFLSLLLSVSVFAKDKLVNSWMTKDKSVTIEFYSDETGGSGYYKVINNTTKKLKISFSYTTNKNVVSKQLFRLESRKSIQGSCFSAGTKNVGIKSIEFLSVTTEP